MAIFPKNVPEYYRIRPLYILREGDFPEPFLDFGIRFTCCCNARKITFDICRKNWNTEPGEIFCQYLQSNCLPCSRCTCNKAMPVAHFSQLFNRNGIVRANNKTQLFVTHMFLTDRLKEFIMH